MVLRVHSLSTLRVPAAAFQSYVAGTDSTQDKTPVAAMTFFTCWSISTWMILLRNPLHVKTLDLQIEALVETPQKKESLKHLFSKMISYMLRK